MEQLNEERINENKHFRILGDFVCGADDPLNLFLSDKALDYDGQKLGHTYLILDNGDILAFYTLKVNGIQIKTELNEYEVLPMIEIARIAVAHDLQGRGLGRQMFYENILPKVREISTLAAVKGIMVFVEEHNEKGIAFYKSLGFKKADESVQRQLNDTFNWGCDLYVVSLDTLSDSND